MKVNKKNGDVSYKTVVANEGFIRREFVDNTGRIVSCEIRGTICGGFACYDFADEIAAMRGREYAKAARRNAS